MDGWCCNVDGDLISYSTRGLGSFPGPLIYSQEPEQFIYQISQKMEDPDLEGIFPFKGLKFPADRGEAAITKAMMAVISSTTTTPSSSAVSSPSTMSNHAGEVSGEQMNNSSRRAFTPYNPVLAPKLELKEINLRGQKMIKGSICFLRRIKSDREQVEGTTKTTTWSAPATSNQLHHVISERKRREKLNESFHRLSMILPPDSKRDKASVLISAKNYLKTLRAQIKELEGKNRTLEAHLPKDEMTDQGDFQVEVMKLGSDEPRSQLEQIHIKITVRAECDIVNLILHVLECLKGMRIAGISSVDARAYSPQMRISASANLKIQIKSCDWNEALFQEAMNRAIDGVAPPAEFLFAV